MTLTNEKKQIVSKDRVLNHGEVYTAEREVNAMLDLVKQETERIESRFLEPACGSGNFLSEVLKRKLDIVEARYKKNQLEFERYAIIAISSIYGIDILEDNVAICRDRLFRIFSNKYQNLFNHSPEEECLNTCKYILEKNIIHGDALTLKTVNKNPEPIVFSEWSPVNGNMMKRRDFTYKELLSHAAMSKLPLFSDLGDEVFLPEPSREYPLTHFLKIGND
jgi:hypothetical protein